LGGKIYLGKGVTERGAGWTSAMFGGGGGGKYTVLWSRNVRERDHLEDLRVEGG